jgi:transposase
MTLHARDLYSVPGETVGVAQAAFPKGNVYMTMRDRLGLWYTDSDYAYLFQSHQGRPAESPGRLNLVLVMQYAEGLSDQQAAEAVRSRIDWKYALGMQLTDSGFHHSVLSEHRQRLMTNGAERQLLDDMLKQYQEQGLLKARGRQRTDSTHVLAAIRDLNRLELIGETLRHALNSLAVVIPDWLQRQVTPDWFDVYGPRFEQYRLPKERSVRQALAERIGRDGYHLLSAVHSEEAPIWLHEIPAVETLRQVWVQQFLLVDDQVQLRTSKDLPPAGRMIQSSHDVEARYSRKRQTEWKGHKVHLTETCDDDTSHLITQVETTPATMPDKSITQTIHTHLADKGLLPQEHLVDAGYVDVDELIISQTQHATDLLGPVQQDTSWQARANQGYAAACFAVDWDMQTVTCPHGKTSRAWRPRYDSFGNDVIEVFFDRRDCAPCPVRSHCTQARDAPRSLKLKPRAQHTALHHARQYQQTPDFKERYKKRAGVEGTISQATRAFDLRRSRHIGLSKTHLQNTIIAAAINLTRAVAWLHQIPLAQTRCSPFAALAPAT